MGGAVDGGELLWGGGGMGGGETYVDGGGGMQEGGMPEVACSFCWGWSSEAYKGRE